MTTAFLAIVSHTPTWVWVVFAVLVLAGLRQTRTQDVAATRVWLVPALLGLASLGGALRGFAGAGVLLTGSAWAAGAVLGIASNRSLDLPRRVSVNADGSFRLEGSIAPLLLFVTIFLVRYGVNVALALRPGLAADPVAATLAALAYGLAAGLLIARARKIWSTRTPRADLQPA